MRLRLPGLGSARPGGRRPLRFDERLERANAALAAAPAGHVLLCGDSHAESLEPAAPEGLAVVNAAVAGFAPATASSSSPACASTRAPARRGCRSASTT